ncbi:MAG TPA: OmpA family protein [Hyphomonas sp.]|nr:OmpA family protein [Hyphomonas sp.]HRK67296.1 OmpA family protein [Hyphomonas sp.]
MSFDPPPTHVAVTKTVRRFRAANGDGLGFFPFGLLPVIGLALLLLVGWTALAPSSIERTALQTAQRVVDDAGATWARVEASGQWITVTGNPPTPEAGQRLTKAIRQAKAPTWLGSARPVTQVTARFGPETPGAGSLAAGAPQSGSAPEYLYRLSGSTLTLDGRMPDIATRDAVIDAANDNRPTHIEEVISNLEPLGTATPSGFPETAIRGVEALKLCNAGTASFTGMTFGLRCEVSESETEAVRRLASAPLAYGSVGEIDILATEIADSCQEELSRLLEAANIEFETGSDRIASSKAALLDLTARAATDCPGRLRIEGHTDDTGSAAINDALSQRRAEAVRAALIQRGVAPSRLNAVGLGATRPIGDNNTEEGRALNRRIEILIERPGE